MTILRLTADLARVRSCPTQIANPSGPDEWERFRKNAGAGLRVYLPPVAAPDGRCPLLWWEVVKEDAVRYREGTLFPGERRYVCEHMVDKD